MKLEIALGFGMHHYGDITVEYSNGGKCNNAPLSDTIRLGNLRRALHDLKVVGYTNTVHSEYDQETNNTNNIVGDFNNSHENIRKYCEDNDALIKLCVVDYNRMPSAYSTPLYTNIESQLISMLQENKVFTERGKIQLPLRNAFKWERIVKYAEDNNGYEVSSLNWEEGILIKSQVDNNVYMFKESNPTGQWIDITATGERTEELSVKNVRHSIIKNKTKSKKRKRTTPTHPKGIPRHEQGQERVQSTSPSPSPHQCRSQRSNPSPSWSPSASASRKRSLHSYPSQGQSHCHDQSQRSSPSPSSSRSTSPSASASRSLNSHQVQSQVQSQRSNPSSSLNTSRFRNPNLSQTRNQSHNQSQSGNLAYYFCSPALADFVSTYPALKAFVKDHPKSVSTIEGNSI